MLVLRDSALTTGITDPDLRNLIDRRFEEICDGEDFDPDLHGFMIVVEPGDPVEVLERKAAVRSCITCAIPSVTENRDFLRASKCWKSMPGATK